MEKKHVISSLSVGSGTTEEEEASLEKFFIKTSYWDHLINENIDIFLGEKGSGKSALHKYLCISKEDIGSNKNLLIVPIEDPRNSSLFTKSIKAYEDLDELQIIWEVYVLIEINKFLKKEPQLKKLSKKIDRSLSYQGIIKTNKVAYLAGRTFKLLKGIKPLISYDTNSGILTIDPVFSSKKPPRSLLDRLHRLLEDQREHLLELLEEQNYHIWVSIDKIDEIIIDDSKSETKCLKALFRTYQGQKNKRLRFIIYLRKDLWQLMIKDGMRGASFLNKKEKISWEKDKIINLLARRLSTNKSLLEYYGIKENKLFEDISNQKTFLKSIFVYEIEKTDIISWILERTKDCRGDYLPRESIKLLNKAIKFEQDKVKIGSYSYSTNVLIFQDTLIRAYNEVSNEYLSDTIYAENPQIWDDVEVLRGSNGEYTFSELESFYSGYTEEIFLKNYKENNTRDIISELERCGLMSITNTDKMIYKIPKILHPALNIGKLN